MVPKVIVMAQGHTGSRIIAEVLKLSGYNTGTILDESFDTEHFSGSSSELPRRFAKRAYYDKVTTEWSWLVRSCPSKTFLHDSPEAVKMGWMSFAAPWVLEQCPNARYIYWLRDPRDSILWNDPVVEMLRNNAPAALVTRDESFARGQSPRYWWQMQQKYWAKNSITIRYEDWVSDSEKEATRLSEFLGREIVQREVHTNSVGRYKKAVHNEVAHKCALEMGYDP